MKNLAMLLSLTLATAGVSFGGQLETSAIRSSMDQRAAEFLSNPAVISVSIGVYQGGKSHTGHYGELTPGQGNRPTDETVYEIASVTKTFTGTLAAQAVLEGKLCLQDEVRELLGEGYAHLEFEGEPIRIRHLITHTGGLPANNRPMELVPEDDEDGLLWKRHYEAERGFTKQNFLADLRDTKLTAAPGERFLYSNISANLMGHLLEKVYGTSFGELLQEKIFRPAGMTETALHLDASKMEKLARGFNGDWQPMPPLPLAETLWGAEGALKSTVPDMLRYAKFQLQAPSDLSRAVVRESHRRLHKLDEGYWVGYFWWVIDVDHDIVSFRHDGGAIGTRGVFIVYPEFDLATYVVTNTASPTIFPSLSILSEQLRDDLKP